MNSETSETVARRPAVRKSFIVIVSIFLLSLFFICTGLTVFVEPPFRLVVGWIPFLQRVIPQVTVDQSGLGMGVLALVGFWIGLHVTGRFGWSGRGADGTVDPTQTRVWRLRWTNAIVICLLLAFAAGTACVGIAHQVVWMSSETMFKRPGVVARTLSKNNLKIIGQAAHNYHEKYATYPAGGRFSETGKAMHGWQSRLLQFTGRSDLYRSINFDRPWTVPENRQVFEQRVEEFEIPQHPPETINGLAPSGYAANSLLMGVGPAMSIEDIKDGASCTLMTGEVNSNHRAWGDPRNWRDPRTGLNKHPNGFGGPFPGGVQFGMADGSARFLSEKIDPNVLRALATPNSADDPGDF